MPDFESFWSESTVVILLLGISFFLILNAFSLWTFFISHFYSFSGTTFEVGSLRQRLLRSSAPPTHRATRFVPHGRITHLSSQCEFTPNCNSVYSWSTFCHRIMHCFNGILLQSCVMRRKLSEYEMRKRSLMKRFGIHVRIPLDDEHGTTAKRTTTTTTTITKRSRENKQ